MLHGMQLHKHLTHVVKKYRKQFLCIRKTDFILLKIYINVQKFCTIIHVGFNSITSNLCNIFNLYLQN